MLNIAGLDFTPDQAETSGAFRDTIDQPIDDSGVEDLSQPAGTIGKGPHDKNVIELIDIVFVK